MDRGRSDAAPRNPDGSAPTGSTDGSFYRSENNFGSSTKVPGQASPKDPADEQASLALREEQGLADSGNTSTPVGIGLLAVILATAVGIGIAARRRAGD